MKGFALAEAVVAMILVMTLALTLFAFFPNYRTFLTRSNKQLMAANLCRQTLEKYYWQSDLTGGTISDPLPTGALGTDAKNPTRQCSIANDSTGNYSVISVTVAWDRN